MPQMVALFNGVGGGAAALIALGRVPPHGAGAGSRARRAVDRDPALAIDRLDLVLRLAGRVRKLQELIRRAADHLSGPEGRQRA